MTYFNGFSLDGEEALFEAYTSKSVYCVAGFSYGAQKALEHAYAHKGRIDKLILLSPAFFQNQKPSFIRTQLRYFESDKTAYVKQFLANVAYPSKENLEQYLNVGKVQELDALLTYIWELDKIQTLLERGIEIEVFFGEKDKIIDVQSALDFFKPLCTTYFLKNMGHSLTH
ncbi:MAG: pimelyl-ACP methyl ester esterase BioV [Sulfurovum sp.]|nr:pimelyl-ACP methyl ester esterase BioV [Sulfurovum sp.]